VKGVHKMWIEGFENSQGVTHRISPSNRRRHLVAFSGIPPDSTFHDFKTIGKLNFQHDSQGIYFFRINSYDESIYSIEGV